MGESQQPDPNAEPDKELGGAGGETELEMAQAAEVGAPNCQDVTAGEDEPACVLVRDLSFAFILFLDLACLMSMIAGLFLGVSIPERLVILMATASMAPLGAWIRYHLAAFNVDWPHFPLYTFIPNIFASLLSTVVTILSLKLCTGRDALVTSDLQIFLKAVGLALCGNLSTVSTFVNELRSLSAKEGGLRHTAAYATATHLTGQVVSCAVLAPFYLARC